MYPRHPIDEDRPKRQTQHWCNVCNAVCESDPALREHYRQCHPEVAARLERLWMAMQQRIEADQAGSHAGARRPAHTVDSAHDEPAVPSQLLRRARQTWDRLRHRTHS
jgi:hypothetical protein